MSASLDSVNAVAAGPPPRKRRRRIVVVLALLALVWFLPTLLANRFVASWLLGRAATNLPGTVQCESVALGWFSPVVLRGVSWRDPDGGLLLSVEQVRTERSLWWLLTHHSAPGKVRLEKPVVHVTFSGNSSNLEQVLRKLVEAPTPSQSDNQRPPSVSVECVGGVIHLHDADTKRSWSLNELHLTLEHDAARKPALEVQVRAGVAHQASATLDARLGLDTGTGAGTCTAKLQAMPLVTIAPLLRRLEHAPALEGALDGNVSLSWSAAPSVSLAGEGECTLRELRVASTRELARLAQVKLPWKLAVRGKRLHLDRAELTCDVGQASVRGVFDLDRALPLPADQSGAAVRCDVDLALLAERCPGLMALHEDVRISGGRLTLDCSSAKDAAGVAWQGTLLAEGLRGTRAGKALAWPEPVRLTVKVRPNAQGWPVFDELKCDANFLQVTGAGNAEQFHVRGNADLTKLHQALGAFCDLGTIRLAGQADFDFKAERTTAARFKATGVSTFRNIDVALSKERVWQDAVLSCNISAVGETGEGGTLRLNQADAVVQSGADVLEARLLEPVADASNGGKWQLRLAGDLGRWRGRLVPWTTALDALDLGGAATFQGKVQATADSVQFSQVDMKATNLRVIGPGLHLREPSFEVQASLASWDRRAAILTLEQAQVRSPALNLNTGALEVRLGPTLALHGAASLYGDLARLSRWFDSATTEPGLAGGVFGGVRVQKSGDRADVSWDLTGQNLVIGPAKQPLLREGSMKSSGQGSVDWRKDGATLDVLRLESSLLTLEAKGRLENFSAQKRLDLGGQLRYDLAKLAPLLRPYLGNGVKVVGTGSRPFHLRGALSAPEGVFPATPTSGWTIANLEGDAGFDWKALHAYGFDIGPAEVRLHWSQGTLKLLPVQATVNDGRLRLEAEVRVEPGPVELRVPAGQVIDRARITPAMCRSALGYAVPALANVTEAEGTVSLTIDRASVPLSAPEKAEVEGKFLLHAAKVGPGPLVRELSGLLRTPAPASLVKEAHVPFQVTRGRVHHRNFELMFPDFTVRTSGSVGLDGSLALVAEMPIPPKWIGNNRLGTALAQRTIQLPIRGTLEQPRLDERALEAALAQFTRDAAAELLKQELDNRLKKLLPFK